MKNRSLSTFFLPAAAAKFSWPLIAKISQSNSSTDFESVQSMGRGPENPRPDPS